MTEEAGPQLRDFLLFPAGCFLTEAILRAGLTDWPTGGGPVAVTNASPVVAHAGGPGCGAWVAKAELLGAGRGTAWQLRSGVGWTASAQNPRLSKATCRVG